jgi:mannitol/fructose-specific phosphotransferase system IIA component
MKSTGIIDEMIKIPQDMILDILLILLKEELNYEITEVLENRAMAVFVIGIDQSKPRQLKALQNIQELLSAYHEFRFSENETLNWRDN